MTNKWIEAAIKYKLPMVWMRKYSDFELYAMTYFAENGGHKYRKLLSAQNIDKAMTLSTEIYRTGGRLDTNLLTSDTWWEHGWTPEASIPLNRAMLDARDDYHKSGRNDNEQAEWQAFQDWRKTK
ncbi:MAG: hypothetical protein JZU60_02015 [Ilumatobacteraceae bacterium]|jgi:hypothetical protein|nr:hypothetical protein [Ilumatobacteraceae bacterium]